MFVPLFLPVFLAVYFIFNTVVGSVVYGIWCVLKKAFSNTCMEPAVYYMLKIVPWVFLIPFLNIVSVLNQLTSEDLSNFFTLFSDDMFYVAVVFIGIWSCGFIFSVRKYLFSRNVWKAIEDTCVACSEKEYEELEAAKKTLGINKRIELLKGDDIQSPCTMGCFRQKIVLPAHLPPNINLQCVYFHELFHCKHYDVLYQHLTYLIVCIYWLLPLSYLLKNELKKWNEFYTDYCVGSHVDELRLYYKTLLVLNEGDSYDFEKAAFLSEKKNFLMERIEKMSNRNRTKRIRLLTVVLTTLLFFAGNASLALASGKELMDAYQNIYELTTVEIEEPMAEKEFVEIYEKASEEDARFFEREEYLSLSDLGKSAKNYSWNISANKFVKSNAFYKKAGSEVTMSAFITPDTSTVRVGVILPDGNKKYVYMKKSGVHTFKITKSGSYRIYIFNTSKKNVTVDIMVR